MTRTFNEKIRCPKCLYVHTVETDFERWVRGHQQLQSRDGIVRFDLDMLLHRYKTCSDGVGTREIQCMMFVEVKTFMADMSDAQRDTLGVLNDLLRNRRKNIHSNPRKQCGNLTKVRSRMLQRDIRIALFGGHLLQMDSSDPDNSSRILWDREQIAKDELIAVLRFENDPDKPHKSMDVRRRSQPWSQIPWLHGVEWLESPQRRVISR